MMSELSVQPGQPIIPAAIPSKKKSKYPWVWWVFLTLSIVVGSMIISLWLVQRYNKTLAVEAVKTTSIFTFTPNQSSGVIKAVASRIALAKSSLLVMAEDLQSVTILESIVTARERGVKVFIILDASQTKARDWLIRKGFGYDQVVLDNLKIRTQYVVIDKSEVIYGSVPFSLKGQQDIADITFTQEEERVSKYFKFFGERYTALNRK